MALTKITSRILDSSGVTTLGTISTGVWQGTAINQTYLVGQSGTNTGDETLARINALDITELGTVSSGVWNGTAIASAYLDADTAHLSTTQTFTGAKTFSSTVTTGGAIDNPFKITANPGTRSLKLTSNSTNYGTFISWLRASESYEKAYLGFTSTSDDVFEVNNRENADMTFHTNTNERVRILATGNVGIGTTSPFNNVQIKQTGDSGNNYVEGTLQVGGGSAVLGAALSYSALGSGRLNLSSLNNSGGANALISLGFGAITSGAPANTVMTLNQSGKVGIASGSASLVYPLEVHGGNGDAIIFKDTTNSVTTWLGAFGGAAVAGALTAGDDFALYAGNAEKVRITSGGNLGIGTTSPNALLHVFGDTGSSANAALRIRGTNTTSRTTRLQFEDYSGAIADAFIDFVFPNAGSNSGSYLGMGVNGTSQLVCNVSGNVGIGTTSPSAKLEIIGSAHNQLIIKDSASSIQLGADDSVMIGVTMIESTSSMWFAGPHIPGATGITSSFQFARYTGSWSTLVTIASGGNFGIGEPNPNRKLNVASGTNGDGIYISGLGTSMSTNDYRSIEFAYSDTDTSYGSSIHFEVPNAASHGGQMSFFTDNTSGTLTKRLTISSAGEVIIPYYAASSITSLNVTTGGLLTTASSDISLKKDITNLNYGINEVLKLNPVSFYWIDNDYGTTREIGFVAQEIEEVVPEVVTENNLTKLKAVNYDKITSLLTKAIQEQQTIIEDLKLRIETLEG